MKNFPLLIFTLVLIGCAATSTRVKQEKTLENHIVEFSTIKPQQVNSLTIANKIHAITNEMQTAVQIDVFNIEMINFGEFTSPSIIIEYDKSSIIIDSYVVEPAIGQLYMFYPIVTALDSNFKVLREKYPKYEFDFTDNVLSNQFELPLETSYVVIHTKPEFTGRSLMKVLITRHHLILWLKVSAHQLYLVMALVRPFLH